MDKKKRIYTVATAHLDTVWSWDFEETIEKYILRTLTENFEMFEKYPTYRFSFEGAYRYELMQEYYPELFEKLKEYVADGRWSVTGSAYENGDVNVPSPEALFRNILLGNGYFDKTFGKRSCDIFLPDCFGFGWALPSIMHHARLLGFTTQKLTWGSAYGRPFDVGVWQGVDGQSVYASIDPRSYSADMQDNWNAVEEKLAKAASDGQDFTYLFHGVGDRGGSARERSIAFTEDLVKNCDKYEVLASPADQIYRDIEAGFTPEQKASLPVWRNELVMTDHAVGGYTSRALGKRWNRRAEELADAAERAGVLADALGVRAYDRAGLNRSWKRVIAHQFHDDIPGTSCQRVYKRSWNDYAVSMNEFATQIEAGEGAVAANVDTSFCQGTAVVVFNPIEQARTECVRARIPVCEKPCVRAYAADGTELPCQVLRKTADHTEVAFVATVPALGYAAVDLRPADDAMTGTLSIGDRTLENERYRVSLNENGDVASVYDKALEKELLAKPVTIGLFNYKGSTDWPAWELRYSEQAKEPDRTAELVSIEVESCGAAYVAYKVTQRDGDSTFTSIIGLAQGGQVVEVYEEAEWRGLETLAKRVFTFTAENEQATYDLGLGAIKRGNMREKLYEVPAQKWADITTADGAYGVSVISECKYGWDKYDDATLRMTIVHTPQRNYKIDTMQSMMDLGMLRWSFAIMGHAGEVGAGTQLAARAFVQPMTAVVTDAHAGKLAASRSFGGISDANVIVRALKLAEDSDEVVVRLNEGSNKAAGNVRLTLGCGIESAREIWADETALGDAVVENGELVADFAPYQIRSFALTLKKADAGLAKVVCTPVELPLDKKIAAKKGETADFALAIPAEQFPETVTCGSVCFRLGDGKAMTAAGQTIAVPEGADKLVLLCGSTGGDQDAVFTIDGEAVTRGVLDVTERFARGDFYDFGQTAYMKTGKIAFEATHSLKDGEVVFAKCQWFYAVELPVAGKTAVTLPDCADVVILAATAVSGDSARLAYPVYDEIAPKAFTFKLTPEQKAHYDLMKTREYICDEDGLPEDDGRGLDY